jgi:hypothetical protein
MSTKEDFELKQQERREYGDSRTNPIQNRADKEKVSKLNKEIVATKNK